MRQRLLLIGCATLLVALAWAMFGPVRHAQAAASDFVAPLPAPLTVLRGFDPPAQPWLPGNRGVDLAATTGEAVVAAADGAVLYAGELAGRGVVSIDHGAIRTTYEPVDAAVARGETVRRGQVIGRVAAVADGCGPPGGCLHWGAIRGDAYLDPLSLLAVPQVRLLPIWADGLPVAAVESQAARSPAAPSTGAKFGGSSQAHGTRGPRATAATAIGAGVALAGVAVAVRPRFARRSSRATAAQPWCASGRCGSR